MSARTPHFTFLSLCATQAQAQRQKLSAKSAKKFAKRAYGGAAGAVNGLSSSLAFTPIQARSTYTYHCMHGIN